MANTASTKSGKKKGKQQTAVGNKSAAPAPSAGVSSDIPERVWQISVIAILLIAAVLRFYDLNLVPLHHDEGVNGNFLVKLVREGAYKYDPENYHGPTLYYFAAWFPWLTRLLFGTAARDHYGLTTITIRCVPALFGLATIGLVFPLRRRLGTIATLSAAMLLAVSPGAVYLSRYFIHETQFAFFTLGIVVAGLRFYDTRNPTWLVLASASAALLFATKETAMISMGVLLIAFGLTHIYLHFFGKALLPSGKSRRYGAQQESAFRTFFDEFGRTNLLISAAIAIAVFLFLNILFYSSFFKNAQGISDALKTFQIWTKTGQTAHVHPLMTYFLWLFRQESPLLLLGVMGAFVIVLKPKNTLALFSALWAFGLIAAYSLIPYKTPWLVVELYPAARVDRRLRDPADLGIRASSLSNCRDGVVHRRGCEHVSEHRSELHKLRQRRYLLRLCLRAYAAGDVGPRKKRRADREGKRRRANGHHDCEPRLLATPVVSARLQAHGLLRTDGPVDRAPHHREGHPEGRDGSEFRGTLSPRPLERFGRSLRVAPRRSVASLRPAKPSLGPKQNSGLKHS